MAAIDEGGVFGWKAYLDLEPLVPSISDWSQMRIHRGAHAFHDRRQRIGEVAILAAPVAVARHDDPAAEAFIAIVEAGQGRAFGAGQQLRQDRPALRVQAGANARPVDRLRTAR